MGKVGPRFRILRLGACAAGLLLATAAPAQIIRTIAGNAINDGRPATETTLVKPQGLAVDANGNLIIADRGNFVVRRVAAGTGVTTVLAGGGAIFDDAVPIPGQAAALDYPVGVAVDEGGNIYFSDYNRHRIRKITRDGLVTTVAGTGAPGHSGDGGKATLAELDTPVGVAVDRLGNLYFSEPNNHLVRRINLNTGIIQTIAGDGTAGNSGDGGPAALARLDGPWGLAVDSAGNLYIADAAQDVIRKVSTNGVITTEVPRTAGLSQPVALAFDPAGVLHVAEGYRVVRVGSAGTLTTIAGRGGSGNDLPQDNVLATSVDLFYPSGLAIDRSGNIFISEEGWNIVRRVDAANRTIRTFAGTLNVLDGGQALNAPLSFPIGIALDPTGNIYIADTEHHRIRRIEGSTDPARSAIRTVIGTGQSLYSPDNTLASSASVDLPLSVSVDARGNLYYTESVTVVRKLDAATGRITTVAGVIYERGFFGDGGPATRAFLHIPLSPLADSAGNVYIADRDNHCVRRVDAATGIIRAVAGICTQPGYSGDGGPATQARMSQPTGLAFDASGNLLIADSGNSVVRRLIIGTGVIQRVAGKGGVYGYSGDGGPPLEAELAGPTGLAVDRAGNIYIADEGDDVIRVIQGNTISTFAGVGIRGFAGDGGLAGFAAFNRPTGVALDGAGNVYVVDSNNNRIRRIALGTGGISPSLAVQPANFSFTVAEGAAPPTPLSLFIRSSGLVRWSAEATTTSGGDWLLISGNGGSTPASLGVSVDPSGLPAGTYSGTISIASPGVTNSPVNVSVSLTVGSPRAAVLALSAQVMSFEALEGGAPPPAQTLSFSNNGSGDLNYALQVSTSRGGNWLSVTPTEGRVSAGGKAGTVAVSVNPAGLAAGLYVGQLTITNLTVGASTSVAVGLLVGAPASRILLTQNSFVFTVNQGSTLVPSQSFNVINIGQGAMPWQIASFVPQGNWLRATPLGGTSDAANIPGSPAVTVGVDASGLAPGVYGGLLVVNAPNARNNPEFATVVLRVLAPDAAPQPLVQPTGLVFTAGTGAAPLVQEVRVQSTGGAALNFTAGTRTRDGGGWLTVSPTSGSISSSADRARFRVQVAPGALPAGVYQGAVTFSFPDGSVREVAVAAILREATAAAALGMAQAQQCAPAQQVLVSTQLSNNFSLPTGWPVPMAVRVTNNCGESVSNSTVAASFSNGDPPIVFQNLRDGQYTATWVPTQPPSAAAPVLVSMRSLHPQLQEATLLLTGSLSLDATNPVINDNGIVNGASFAGFRPVSPGSIFSLFGVNLAAVPTVNTMFPLPTTLGGVSVRIGGRDAPLFFAGPNQINGQVPVELAGVPSVPVVVTARGIVSAQRTLQLDSTQPGIFLIGPTQGAVLNQDFSINSAANPAAPGSVIQIFATGLGPTNPAVPTGARAPRTEPFALVTNPVAVTIGGMNATVRFQALAPDFVGLYQVNAEVPMGVTPGDAVRMKITQNGVESNEVTIAVR